MRARSGVGSATFGSLRSSLLRRSCRRFSKTHLSASGIWSSLPPRCCLEVEYDLQGGIFAFRRLTHRITVASRKLDQPFGPISCTSDGVVI